MFCMLLVAVSASSLRAAETGAPAPLPLLFDARERLPQPDLSDLIRLRFLTGVDFPPFNFTDATGRLTGFHIDLMRAICAELKIEPKCQVEALPFGDLQAALASGQGDAVMAGVAVTADLRNRFAFSRPYMTLPARFVRNLKTRPAAEIAAGAFAGRPVGVVANTVHAGMLASYFPTIRSVPFPDRDKMLKALKDGAVDAVFSDGLQSSFWVASSDAAQCCALFDGPYFSERFLGEGLSVMMRVDDTVLAAAIDHALLVLARNGRLQELYLRYFPNGLY